MKTVVRRGFCFTVGQQQQLFVHLFLDMPGNMGSSAATVEAVNVKTGSRDSSH